MKKFILISMLALAACTSTPAPKPGASDTPDLVVYRTQGYFNAAVKAETAYVKLPACGKPASPKICSDITIVRKLRPIRIAANSAIAEAQVAVRTPGFGESKITTLLTSATALTKAFQEITSTLPKEK